MVHRVHATIEAVIVDDYSQRCVAFPRHLPLRASRLLDIYIDPPRRARLDHVAAVHYN